MTIPQDDAHIKTRKRYSKDLRERVIYQRITLGHSTTEIAKNLAMSPRVVRWILQLWNEIGSVVRDPKTYALQGRPRLLNNGCTEFLLALIERHPDIYLDELAERLMEQRNVDVSLATVHRTLKLLGISSKKVDKREPSLELIITNCLQLSKTALERCEDRREHFQFEIGHESPDRLVFTDESAINTLTTYRTMGRAMRGQRAQMKSYFQRGNRYSVLPALSLDGIVYAQIVQGSFNGDTFKIFLQGLLLCMNPYPGPRSVLVMDNCAIHHVEGVAEMCHQAGVKLMYLPPYSPDYNPIEECFSFMKHYIRRHGVRFRYEIESGQEDNVFYFILEALSKVTEKHARGWFHDSGYI